MAVLGEMTIFSTSLNLRHSVGSIAGFASVFAPFQLGQRALRQPGGEREEERTGLESDDCDEGEGEAEGGGDDDLVGLVEVLPDWECHRCNRASTVREREAERRATRSGELGPQPRLVRHSLHSQSPLKERGKIIACDRVRAS